MGVIGDYLSPPEKTILNKVKSGAHVVRNEFLKTLILGTNFYFKHIKLNSVSFSSFKKADNRSNRPLKQLRQYIYNGSYGIKLAIMSFL